MAGETFLLSGDQIATFTNAEITHLHDRFSIRLAGVKTLGDPQSRFFLVRTSSDADPARTGSYYAIFNAVDDGTGTQAPGATPVVEANLATPDAYGRTAVGNRYIILGLSGGPRFVVNLDGFQDSGKFVVIQGNCADGGFDGELNLADLSAASPGMDICFLRGTLVATPFGDVPVEQLGIGDVVLTADGGAQPIRRIGFSRVNLSAGSRHLRPVRIARHALGQNRPCRDVVVAPAHRILIDDPDGQQHPGREQVPVAARLLVDGVSITCDDACDTVEYWHLYLDRNEIIYTSGLASESVCPGDTAGGVPAHPAWRGRAAPVPRLAERLPPVASDPARTTVRWFETRVPSGAKP